jgi:DNA-binding NarL/FixJ family response regulator
VPIGDGAGAILVQIIAPNRLVRSGLRLLVESAAGLVVVSEVNRIEEARALGPAPDVILVDMEYESAGSVADLCEVQKASRVLVLAREEDAGRAAIVPRGASGILQTHRAEDSLVQAIRAVYLGGQWPARPAG